MIVVIHLAFFALFFGLGLPSLEAATGGAVTFGGGVGATIALAVAAEVVVIVAAVVARILNGVLGVNPLLQRNKGDLVANLFIFVCLSIFLYSVSALLPALLGVTLFWALALSASVCAVLEVMVLVKRHIIASSGS